MLNGAGVIKALDSRTSETLTAGILDMATYWASLSGSSWLQGTFGLQSHSFALC